MQRTILVLTDVTAVREKEQQILVKNSVIKEIHHRVKNNLNTIAGILRMQARRASNEETKEALRRAVGRILGISQIHEILARQSGENVDWQELLGRLDGGEIDFALVEGFFKKSEYDFQKYSDENYIAVCSPDYAFRQEPDCIENLFQERLLLREAGSGTREVLERYLDAKNLSVSDFERVTEAGSLQTIKELTKAGCGITFLYEVAVREELESGMLRKIPLRDFQVSHEFTFIWRRGSIYAEQYREVFRRFSA